MRCYGQLAKPKGGSPELLRAGSYHTCHMRAVANKEDVA
jgi:hypothetical protein